MVRRYYKFTRPDASVPYWEDYYRPLNDPEWERLWNHNTEFLNSMIDSAAGEAWGWENPDSLTRQLFIQADLGKIEQIENICTTDPLLVQLLESFDQYNFSNSIDGDVVDSSV